MARYTDATAEIEALIEQLIPSIRDVFLTLIRDVTDNVVLQQVVKAFQMGDPVAAFEALGLSDAAMRPITKMIEDAYEAGGVTTGGTFPARLKLPFGPSVVFRFDVRNSRAEQWLRENSARLITEIQEETRVVVRNVMEDGMRRGVNPATSALDLVGRLDASGHRVGGTIGLTTAQEGWVRSTRADLTTQNPRYFDRQLRGKNFDKIVKRAFDKGEPLPAETVERLVTQYKANALRYRGEVIGRTEAIKALNKAQFEAINQAIDMGAIKASAVTREWDSAGDFRVRETHRLMDGQKVAFDQPFKFPLGGLAMYPGDTDLNAPASETIQCRCRVKIKIDWLAGAVEYARKLPADELAELRGLAFAKLPGEK